MQPETISQPIDANVVKIYRKHNYGRVDFYPANATAELFAKIAGRTTLQIETRRAIKALGYTIEEVLPPEASNEI